MGCFSVAFGRDLRSFKKRKALLSSVAYATVRWLPTVITVFLRYYDVRIEFGTDRDVLYERTNEQMNKRTNGLTEKWG